MNNKTIKILAPILIFSVIIGIWFAKNIPQQEMEEAQLGLEFSLSVASVDLVSLQSNNMPIIIDFGADECVPCKEMAPILRELNAEMQESVIIQFVDVWKNPDGATGFPVQIIPTQFFYTADSKPYVPSENVGVEFIMYADRTTGEHLFTLHQGGLTETQMRTIIDDMLGETVVETM